MEQMQQDEEDSKKRRGPRGGVAQPFPEKLHLMLSTVDRDDIVSWQPHGRCFAVHKPKEFVSEIMPVYFKQTKLTSFQRQLNLYGFCRLTSGRDRGAYYHELFLRGRPFLCKRMMRTRIKGTGIKAASSPQTEPDFYQMPPVKNFVQPSASMENMCNIVIEQDDQLQEGNGKRRKGNDCIPSPALVTPPATVTPLHTPAAHPPELPREILLGTTLSTMPNMTTSETKTSIPRPDSIIDFEGQQFHYLDPSSFTEETATKHNRGDWVVAAAAADFALMDIIMV